MDIFVKYPNSDDLHHYRSGDGPGSDAASFRTGTLGGRRDLKLFDAEGVELDTGDAEEVVAEEVVAEEVVAEEAVAEEVAADE